MSSDPFSLDSPFPDTPASAAFGAGTPQHTGPNPQDYLAGLNAPQRAAVETINGPVLVLAGAGTGKTRVLTTRIAHIIGQRAAAHWNILAVTFTNKAAREMQDRIARVLGHPVEGMWIGTFHSLCNRILRRHAELVGLKPGFTILDTDDQIRLLKQLIQAEGIDDKKWPARQLAGLIDRWKNAALTPEKVGRDEAHSFADGKALKLYKAYQERLLMLNAVDFGDLLLHVITLFQNNADVLAKYHQQFRYMLVDEYQDTNVAQYLWLRLLARGSNNICCVGDDDQSIYGWRGAEVGNILRFESDFPGATVVRLEQNYRSSGHILAAASGLIQANESRLGKTLWTEAGDGDKVRVRGVWDAREEARAVCDEIESHLAHGHRHSEIAILVRAGFQTREFEERFIQLGLPYKVVGGPRFYERAEIRDAMAYLRTVMQSDDDLAFERIINTPKRGVGAASVRKIHDYARSHAISMTRAARRMCDEGDLRGKAKASIAGLLGDIDRWRLHLDIDKHTEVADMILEESGYRDMWRSDTSPDAPGRLENLKELVNAISDFENLQGFLEHIALVMDIDDKSTNEKVSLMTLHAAKGLEFDTVFLPGWEEGVFPNQRALDDSGHRGLEEERRLGYVGITRAKKRATIYFAANRQIFGQWQSSLVSRFVEELPEDHLDVETEPGIHARRSQRYDYAQDDDVYLLDNASGPSGYSGSGYSAYTSSPSSGSHNADKYGPGWHRSQARGGYGGSNSGGYSGGSSGKSYNQRERSDAGVQSYTKPATPQRSWASLNPSGKSTRPNRSRSAQEAPTDLAIGERVFHQKFGYGIIEDLDGDKAEVHFDKAGSKRIVARFLDRADEVS